MELMDLHTHSNISDGTLSPTELVRLAHALGLRALALTDHDNLGGLDEALEASREFDVELIPGVEISVEFKPGTMHIVGYYIWEGREALAKSLEKLQQARADRNPRMVQKLNELGLDVTFEDVRRQAGGEQIGRPHMAKALLEKGYVSSMNEAFDRYLGKGQPAYVDKFRLEPDAAVAMIRKSGGVPGLAHPFTLEVSRSELEALVSNLKDQGLEAIEVLSPEHNPDQTHFYQGLAVKYNLVTTGGTDFHGSNKPGIQLGTGYGNFKVPYDLLKHLKKRRDDIRKSAG